MSSVVECANKAAFEGNLDDLRSILTDSTVSFTELIDKNDSGRGPLHFAILGKQVEVVATLLENYDCSPFTLDEDGWSPLHIAASVGNVEIIDLLLSKVGSINPNQPDASVIYCNQLTFKARQSPLHLAAAKGHEQAVLKLLGYGASASLRNYFGQTPLHRAACAGETFVVAVLLEADSSVVNWTDTSEDKNSALHLAAEDGHFSVVRLLCEIGAADLSLTNASGKTAAQVARSDEIREYLQNFLQ